MGHGLVAPLELVAREPIARFQRWNLKVPRQSAAKVGDQRFHKPSFRVSASVLILALTSRPRDRGNAHPDYAHYRLRRRQPLRRPDEGGDVVDLPRRGPG